MLSSWLLLFITFYYDIPPIPFPSVPICPWWCSWSSPLPPFPLIHDAPPILFIICPPFAFTPSPPPHSWYFLPSPFSCFPDVFSSPFPLPSLRQELDSNQETEPAPVNTDPDSHSAPETRLIGLFFHFQETLRNAILNLTFYFFPPGSIHLRVQWKCILPTKMFISSLLNISCETAWAAFCFPRKSPQNSRLPIFTGQDNGWNFFSNFEFQFTKTRGTW